MESAPRNEVELQAWLGRKVSETLPRDRPLHIVVGKPLLPPAGGVLSQPTEAQIDEHHRKYITALTELYDRHKATYYGKEAARMVLEIW